MIDNVTGAQEPIERLKNKLFELATKIGVPAIKAAGYESKEAFIEKKLYLLNPTLDITNHMSGAHC